MIAKDQTVFKILKQFGFETQASSGTSVGIGTLFKEILKHLVDIPGTNELTFTSVKARTPHNYQPTVSRRIF